MTPSRSERVSTVVLSWLAHACLGAAIGTAWLSGLPLWVSARSSFFVPAALLSDTAMLAIVPALLVLVLALLLPSARALAAAQALVWTLFQLLVYADTRIWRLFRYHFNPMVWNVITTPGSEDAIDLGFATWAFAAAGCLAIFALSWLAWTRLFPRIRPRLVRNCALALLGVAVLEKSLYAWADLARDRSVTGLARAFPLYQRLTLQKLAQSVFRAHLEDRAQVELGSGAGLLHYPLEEPRIDPSGRRPNVLVFVIDSLRADMLAPATMPRTSAFLARARRFDDHLSGGNATRFGIFSLLYGIHGTYWMPVVEEHAPPVLITTLDRLGYDLRALSSSALTFPEFRSTAFVTMEDRVEDHFPIPAKEDRDAHLAVRFDEWLGEREASHKTGPFFCFAFADAPHGTYAWPKAETVFRPCVERVDFLEMSGSPSKERIEAVFNSYRNAVHWDDEIAGRMIDALERRKLLDDTIVVVTGDHGEEFFEHGYFGHTSNFAREQTHVPFVVAGPGFPPGVETRPSSHVDLATTLLEILGADPAQRSQWAQGENLLDLPERRDRVIAGWEEVALRVPGGILRVPLEGSRGFVEAYDENWKRLDDEQILIRGSGAAIGKLARDCRRFLR
jgi:membrane-anchored protein YejM (alkaline phosphatase superfamily)